MQLESHSQEALCRAPILTRQAPPPTLPPHASPHVATALPSIFHVTPGSSPHTTMPVPFEAVIPMVLVVTLFGVTGTGYSLVTRAANDGKVRTH